MEEVVSSGGLGACARPTDADDGSLQEKVEKLEGWVNEMYEWTSTEDVRNEERIERIEHLVIDNYPSNPRREATGSRDRKPLLDHKAVQSIAQLTDNKGKFKEWNIKCIN